MTDTAKEVERPKRPEPCVLHMQDSVRTYPVDAVHFSSLTRYANQAERLLDARDAELAALRVKLEEAEKERDEAYRESALSCNRLGDRYDAYRAAKPRPMLTFSGWLNMRIEAGERSEALVGKLKEAQPLPAPPSSRSDPAMELFDQTSELLRNEDQLTHEQRTQLKQKVEEMEKGTDAPDH